MASSSNAEGVAKTTSAAPAGISSPKAGNSVAGGASSGGATASAATLALTPAGTTGSVSGGVVASRAASSGVHSEPRILDRRRLADLVKEVDPLEQLDEDVEEMLLQIADDFIDNVVSASCQLAKHRRASTVEAKDVQLHLERNWNMWIPGFGSEELRPYKKQATTEAHRQRIALIKKVQKKL